MSEQVIEAPEAGLGECMRPSLGYIVGHDGVDLGGDSVSGGAAGGKITQRNQSGDVKLAKTIPLQEFLRNGAAADSGSDDLQYGSKRVGREVTGAAGCSQIETARRAVAEPPGAIPAPHRSP